MLPKLSGSSSISHLNDIKSLTQRGENRSHGLPLATFRPSWAGLIVPCIKVDMRVTDTLRNKPFKEQSGNNSTGNTGDDSGGTYSGNMGGNS